MNEQMQTKNLLDQWCRWSMCFEPNQGGGVVEGSGTQPIISNTFEIFSMYCYSLYYFAHFWRGGVQESGN